MKPPYPTTAAEALAIAAEYDRQRDCYWNNTHLPDDYGHPRLCARDFPEFASLGGSCHATLLELALLSTLRPCKHCGSDHIFFGYYKVSCCSCLDESGCRDCRGEPDDDGESCESCQSLAINMNLPDAITLWNLKYADDGPTGRVVACG